MKTIGFLVLWLLVLAPNGLRAQEPVVVADSTRNLYFGELDAQQRVFRFLIELKIDDEGKNQGTLTSLDEGSAQFKLDELTSDENRFEFQLKRTAGVYVGKWGSDKSSIEGEWKQGGATIPLVFKRVTAEPEDHPDETWQGTLAAGIQKLKLQFRVYTMPDGKRRVLMDSLSQHVGGLVGTIEQTSDSLKLEIAPLSASYEGKIETGGAKVVGKWKQGPAQFDLTLEKIAKPEIDRISALKRPQTPKPPFPYRIEDIVFQNPADQIDLAGTLTSPEGDGPFAAAILVSGSGPQDRDETLFDHKPFFVLADHLTRNGIAVLRYDERGVGRSTGNYATATTEDFTRDALAAIQFLRTRREIDPDRIGVIGHSEGGIVAPWVAAQDPKTGWIILLAGPGVNGEKIMLSQGRLIVAAAGGTPADLDLQTMIQTAVLELLSSGAVERDVEDAISSGAKSLTAKLKKAYQAEANPDPKSDPESPEMQAFISQSLRANLAVANTPWFRFFLKHEPAPILKQVRCPVLAVNGEKDVQVDPRLNLPEIEAALREGGNQHFTTRELPGLNHLFQTAETGSVLEYEASEQTLSPVLLETVTGWLRDNVLNKKE